MDDDENERLHRSIGSNYRKAFPDEYGPDQASPASVPGKSVNTEPHAPSMMSEPRRSPLDPPPVQPGTKFGSAEVTHRETIKRPITSMHGQPGAVMVYDRYTVRLADSSSVTVDIARTPVGKGPSIPWGTYLDAKNPLNDRQVDQARALLEQIGKTRPDTFKGMGIIDAATSGLLTNKTGTGPAGGWFDPASKGVSVTTSSLAAPRDYARYVLEHESGHALGFKVAPAKGYSPGFAAALTSDGNRTTPYAASFAKNFPETHLAEAYAEAFQHYVRDPDAFRKSHPAQAAIIERDITRAQALDKMRAATPGAARPAGAPHAASRSEAPKAGAPDAGAPKAGAPDADAPKAGAPDAARPPNPAPAKPPVPAGPNVVTSVLGKVGRRVLTAAASPLVEALEAVIDVMTPSAGGPSGWFRNDRQDWVELLTEGDKLVAQTPGLQRGEAIIRLAKQKGRPLSELIVRHVKELDRQERERQENERIGRETSALSRDFWQKHNAPPKAPLRR